MSEMGELFAEHRRLGQQRRANNRASSAERLAAAGVSFESKNAGAHLIVSAGSKRIDFWPGTGLWIVRGDPRRRYGVQKLIRYTNDPHQVGG
ncbi:hypothetical protein [Denitromonas halophila]|uniref:Uncharacterized protein n=1 Tax=Denitromonas halophila TaxID=1629404 RepID=A0A557QSN0_9RHOO|nr:hypothetical protein [Denitromonas halophila]TVO55920.1 hypothetical protein FHP91_11970 [Denitromonas halophila]